MTASLTVCNEGLGREESHHFRPAAVERAELHDHDGSDQARGAVCQSQSDGASKSYTNHCDGANVEVELQDKGLEVGGHDGWVVVATA